jgi:hypothetical protein
VPGVTFCRSRMESCPQITQIGADEGNLRQSAESTDEPAHLGEATGTSPHPALSPRRGSWNLLFLQGTGCAGSAWNRGSRKERGVPLSWGRGQGEGLSSTRPPEAFGANCEFRPDEPRTAGESRSPSLVLERGRLGVLEPRSSLLLREASLLLLPVSLRQHG